MKEGQKRGRQAAARFQGRAPAKSFKCEWELAIPNSELRLSLCRGDITVCPTEAIVNAANLACLGGKGVDGAIHKAAGPELRALCMQLPEVRKDVRCPWGEAKITGAGQLPKPIAYVIHTVGPIHPASTVWGDKRGQWKIDYDASQVNALLRSAYDACFDRCEEKNIRSVGFPAISCGIFGFPYEAATSIAFESILARVHSKCLREVRLVTLEQPAWDALISVCKSLLQQGVLVEAGPIASLKAQQHPTEPLPTTTTQQPTTTTTTQHPTTITTQQSATTTTRHPTATTTQHPTTITTQQPTITITQQPKPTTLGAALLGRKQGRSSRKQPN